VKIRSVQHCAAILAIAELLLLLTLIIVSLFVSTNAKNLAEKTPPMQQGRMKTVLTNILVFRCHY